MHSRKTSTPLDFFIETFEKDQTKKDKEIIELMRRHDTDGDGEFSAQEVAIISLASSLGGAIISLASSLAFIASIVGRSRTQQPPLAAIQC